MLEDTAWKTLPNADIKLRILDHAIMDANINVSKKSPFLFSYDYKVHAQLSSFTLLVSQLTAKLTIIIQHVHTEGVC